MRFGFALPRQQNSCFAEMTLCENKATLLWSVVLRKPVEAAIRLPWTNDIHPHMMFSLSQRPVEGGLIWI